MIHIRQGTVEDIDALVAMGGRFFNYSAFSGFIPFDPDAVRASLTMLLERGVVLVATRNEQIVGGIVGVVTPVWFNHAASTATELAWWVDEEHRYTSAGIKLYRAFEAWAKEQGVDAILMCDLIVSDGQAPVEKLYSKLGFTTVERAHIKKVS